MKKKKSSLQKHLKKQELHKLAHSASPATKPEIQVTQPANTEATAASAPDRKQSVIAENENHGRELRKTFWSVVVICILFAAAYYYDQKQDFLSQLGDKLYTILRLNK